MEPRAGNSHRAIPHNPHHNPHHVGLWWVYMVLQTHKQIIDEEQALANDYIGTS